MNWDMWPAAITYGVLVLMCIIYLIVSLSSPNRAWVLKDNLRYALVFIIILLVNDVYLQTTIIDLETDLQIAESKFDRLEDLGIKVEQPKDLWFSNTISIDVKKLCSDRSKNGSTE